MNTSPGTQLVWALAAREAIAARREEIEPEHFFCGLLKLAEVQDDILKGLVARSPTVEAVIVDERDGIQALLQDWSLPGTRVRRRLRRFLGRGDHEHTGSVVHRSAESRALFGRAIQMAEEERELRAPHLLQALLAEPTPAIAQVIQEVGAAPPEPELQVPVSPGVTPLLERYTRDLLSRIDATRLPLPARYQPQVTVLSLSLNSTDSDPILLICAPRIPLAAVLAHTAQRLQGKRSVLELLAVEMLGEVQGEKAGNDLMADLLDEAAELENLVLFADATKRTEQNALSMLSLLQPALTGSPPRLVVAVDEELFRNSIEPSAEHAGLWQTIWLHELSGAGVPAEL